MRLPELRVTEVHALAEMVGGVLEVRGEVVIRQARRLSDHANHPDPMLELDGAAVRAHGAAGPGLWDEVRGLSLNRDRVTVLVPFDDDADPGPDPQLVEPARAVRVKLICPSVEVTGFVTVPVRATLPAFIHETRRRFLAVTRARIIPSTPVEIEGFERIRGFCLVNRHHLVASTESDAEAGRTY